MQLSNKGLTSVFEMSQEVCDMHSELTAMLQHNAQAVSTILEGVNTQRSLLQRGIWLLSGMANVITKWVPSKIEEIITAVTVLWYVCLWTVKLIEEQGLTRPQHHHTEDIRVGVGDSGHKQCFYLPDRQCDQTVRYFQGQRW
jgi:hypothetical protein